ncbi:MAG: PAS domain S-box protein [Alphaproteobacteria bacterium]|nr:PAS domain S-box protein [Alphaproteobacteria bacterium]
MLISGQNITASSLLKAIVVASLPALVVLATLTLINALDFAYFICGYLAVAALCGLYVLPLLSNMTSLTRYVSDLAHDKRTRAPDLRFLSNFAALSDAFARLQRTWDRQKQEMETVITEREILVDTLPDILIMTNQDTIIVRTNRAARAIFGQNLAGRRLLEIIPSPKLKQAVAIVLEDFRGQQVEFFLDEPINRDFQAIIERFPIPSEGGISLVITLNDITEQKRIQRMRADFVANASHEIRTPLASIIGFVETLRGPAKDDPKARDEFLKVMAEQAERMSKLVNDLLSLSKIEMNAHNTPTGKVDMARMVRAEKQHFEWALKQKNVTVRMKAADNLPFVRGDESELAQVVRNLLSNAIKYTNSDSEVTMSLRLVSDLPADPSMRNLSRAMLFSVKDQGEGIPKEHLPRLTERFYRVDSARTRKVGGTGLGLAIVKHVLARHHGVLTIDSEVGKGSVFNVYLPLYEEEG